MRYIHTILNIYIGVVLLCVLCFLHVPQNSYAQTPTLSTPVADPMVAPDGVQKFTPLTGIPGLTDRGDMTLEGLINALYRLVVVLGAFAAVIKITLAGFSYMTTDSFGSKGEAKEEITSSLLGLLIILSTVLILETIFGSLNLNFLQNAPTYTLPTPSTTTVAPTPLPPTKPDISSYDPKLGCSAFTASGLECSSGKVGVFVTAGITCAPQDEAKKTIPGQGTFQYITEMSCKNNVNTQMQIDNVRPLGYLAASVPRGTDHKEHLKNAEKDCDAIGGSKVIETKDLPRANWAGAGRVEYTCVK